MRGKTCCGKWRQRHAAAAAAGVNNFFEQDVRGDALRTRGPTLRRSARFFSQCPETRLLAAKLRAARTLSFVARFTQVRACEIESTETPAAFACALGVEPERGARRRVIRDVGHGQPQDFPWRTWPFFSSSSV